MTHAGGNRSRRLPGTPRERVLAAAVGVALLLAVWWCYARLADSRDNARAAAADLAACRESAARVAGLRGRPVLADAREAGAMDLAQRIEAAAKAADFPDGAVGRIDPEPARRVGDSPYREGPTHVRLQRVTLEQLFNFLHALGSESEAGGAGLRVKDVRLSAPRGEEAGDRWSVEVTLTHYVYDPAKPAATGAGQL